MRAQTLSHQERQRHVDDERRLLLEQIVCVMRAPMTILSFVWIALIIANLVWGLPYLARLISDAIWILFVLEFLVEIMVAPDNTAYLKKHWLTALSLFLPAFSVLRLVGAIQMARLFIASGSLSLLSVLTAINRGMQAARRVMGHRKTGYVAVLTVIVVLLGAAGMCHFENPAALHAQGDGSVARSGGGLHSYAGAVWWTAMIMTTIGSSYFPVTAAGRILCFFLALYAISVFGYLTAAVASYFVGRDQRGDADQGQGEADSPSRQAPDAEAPGSHKQTAAAHGQRSGHDGESRTVRERVTRNNRDQSAFTDGWARAKRHPERHRGRHGDASV